MKNRESSQLTHKPNFTFSELVLAFEATLEVWSTALELRDREAKGHTQRVTEMALGLAEALGVNNKELVHIRRGALLHDLGNLLVPESILHKQGELTVEEWVTIHMHPFYALELIGPIEFLGPALNIPYCHHEKWDGTGYPRGLKEELIPLAARIFAVVDVWDALISDRPYRKAWPEAKARQYIQEQAGLYFDPQVVRAFMDESFKKG
jgi:HD-GYP domain-containing protein (c-di-GMP phosphodiesterase class II)